MQQEVVEHVVCTVGWNSQHKWLAKQLTTVCIVRCLPSPERSTHAVTVAVLQLFMCIEEEQLSFPTLSIHIAHVFRKYKALQAVVFSIKINTLLELFLRQVQGQLSSAARLIACWRFF